MRCGSGVEAKQAMDFTVRKMTTDEWPLLERFLYEAVYVPDDFVGEVPHSIIYDDPKCRAAFERFGARPDDRAMVAEVGGEVIGACWARTTDEYGHIDDKTPSFSVSLYEPYRGKGIGTAMMHALLDELRVAGYARASLSVQKKNPALRLYERLGFRIIGDGFDETEWLMTCRLDSCIGLEFHRLSEDDLPSFIEIRLAQLLEEGASENVDLRPALGDYYVRHLADDTFVSWLALDGNRIVGTSGLSVVEKPPYFGCPTGRIALVSSMFTDPAYRRRGIARDLLCRVLDEAKARGCGIAQITASDAGVPLYRTLGFSRNRNFFQLEL